MVETDRNNNINTTMLKSISNEDPLNLQLDTFESLCRKATDITRTMQHYHMDELITPPSIEHPVSSFQSVSTITELYDGLDDDDLIIKEEDLEKDLEEQEMIDWRETFLDVMSSFISYSEELENLSTELLRTKNKVREFVLLQKSLLEKYEQQEQIYKDRLFECEQVSQYQNTLIDHLIDLNNDLINSSNKHHQLSVVSKSATTTSSSTLYNWSNIDTNSCRSDYSTTLSSFSATSPSPIIKQHYAKTQQKKPKTNIHHRNNNNNNTLELLRYKLANWIGGGIGSGRVVHSFEGPVNGTDIIIAGSGALISPVLSYKHTAPSFKITAADSLHEHLYRYQKNTTSSIHHLSFQHHQYMVHITQRDRIDKFHLLPKSLWVPDEQVRNCQFSTRYHSCSIQFSFINRKHHCRKCGKVVCQRHSLNRLPLFSNHHIKESWHRVCDDCFSLLTPSNKETEITLRAK
ncbi:hypothetical protein K501DRAFT_251629 [Backusella circina FSU 941]|nr:hypothetical protein K501DRAFT_251629 [Backusella circina FSU 941]